MNKRLLTSFVCCLLAGFFLPFSVYAATIVGPQDFAVSWFGVHHSSHSFSADPAEKGQLHVTKKADATYRTGFLLINGKRVDLHSFLRGSGTDFAEEIKLEKNNTIRIFLVGKEGASIAVSIGQGPASPPPEIVFNAAPPDILLGASSTLEWSTKDADSVSIAPGIGAVDPSGTLTVTPASTTEYTLTATGPGGAAEARTTVSVTIPPPTVTLQATPLTITPGESASLSWNSTNADTCTIAPEVGSIDCSGSISVTPSATTAYSITATGPSGIATADVVVTVEEPRPTVSISASPASIVLGGSTLLSWDSQKVTSVHIDNGIGSVTLTGSQAVSPTATTTYIITGTGVDGTVSSAVTVEVAGNPEPQPEGSFGARYNSLIPPDATVETYDEKRFSLVTGKVQDETGQPLAGAAVTVHGHPGYGTAATGDDGGFTLPVEGGGYLTVIFKMEGRITSHRQVYIGWNDYGIVEPISMLPVDPVATAVVFDGNPAMVVTHTATEVTDSFGSRAATMVFTGDNQAFLLDEQGKDVQTLNSVTVRATEYATPESMPAKLPPNSAYTYCSELQVDGAERVRFAKPVPMWVDNFLGFEVGEVVPVGYYDRDKAQWVPSNNGVVVRLLDTNGDGIVDALDSTGDGQPDDLNNNGSFSDEVRGLTASRFQPGATFWRAEVKHFTPWDCNWPYGPPPDAAPPNGPAPDPNPEDPSSDDCSNTNSYVKHKTRLFHEDIAIPGTGLTLHYASNRVKGYDHIISVVASGDTVPASLKSIMVKLEIAGNIFADTLEPKPNQSVEFVWDGRDQLGNFVEGGVVGRVSIGFVYDAVYMRGGDFDQAFAQAGSEVTGIPARSEVISWERYDVNVSGYEGQQFGSGWSISNNHYLIGEKLLLRGDGTSASDIVSGGLNIITTVAGNGVGGYSGDNGPATSAGLNPQSVAVDATGNIFIADTANHRIRKVDSNGIITTVVGNGSRGYSGDNGPATSAGLNQPKDVAVDTKGNIFIADTANHRIRKVDSNGIITTVAGNGFRNEFWYMNNIPATNAELNFPNRVAVDPIGNMFFLNGHFGSKIWKVDNNGIITRVSTGFIYLAEGIAVDVAGNLFVANSGYNLIYKIDTNGITTKVAGNGSYQYSGDYGPATSAGVNFPQSVAVDAIGNLFIVDYHRIRTVDTNGVITTVAGNGIGGYSGDNGPAIMAGLNYPKGVAVDVIGNLFIADASNKRIRKISPNPLAQQFGVVLTGSYVPAGNNIAHVFSAGGRHLQTVDSNTGNTLTTFNYDADNRLITITDRFNNTITINRDAVGNPTAIISPYGHRTGLRVDGENNLTDIDFEDGTGYSFGYTSDGLMTSMINPRGLTSTHTFDNTGRVISTEDPEHGIWTLDRIIHSNGAVESSVTSSENNTVSHLDTREPGDVYNSVTTNPSGDTSTFVRKNQNLDDSEKKCGMSTDIRYTLDKKSRLKVPQTVAISSPAGLTSRFDLNKTYVDNAVGLTQTSTATSNRNGKTTTSITDYKAGTATSTSPAGRKATSTFDLNTLKVGEVAFGGLLPSHFDYDSHGHLSAATTGTRNVSYGYDSRGNLTSVVDPLSRTTSYSYDLLDRPTRIDRPDSSTLQFQYDASGNLTVLTTPVPAENQFAYNGVNRVSGFTTPLGSTTSYAYDKERKLTTINLPSGKTISNTYTHGSLTGTTTAEWTNSYTYSCGDLPASISRGSEQLNYTYDGTLPKSIAQSGTVLGNIGFTYNNDFNLTAMSYGGSTASLGYDNDGLLTAAGRFTIARNAANGLPELVSAGSFQLSRSFNGYGEVKAARTSLGSSGFSYDLTRNDSSRITAKSEQIEGATSQFAYSYDTVGRLLTVTKDGLLAEEYRYDNNGNRTYEMNTLRAITGRTFTHSDEDHTLTAGPISYGFDHDNNLTTRREGAETTQYRYSSTGELQRVTLPDNTLIEYINDPLGRRIAKKVNGTIAERYLWLDQTTLLAVYDGAGNLRQRFEYADDRVPYAMTAGSTTYSLTYDQVGSLRLITDNAGNSVKRVDYDSFGNIISDSNPAFAIPFGFAGGLHDRDTGLVRFGYRDYMPEIGKWTAKDPILFAGGDSNLYGYVQNDPVNFIDPWGLYWFRQSWQKPGVIGRPDTPVPPRGTVSELIEQHVPAGYTFGEMHDTYVDIATTAGLPDWVVNIPSMSTVYNIALTVEMLRALGILEQPKPSEQVTPCQ